MMNFLRSLASIFAKPLGAAINTALASGAAAVVTWSVSKGVDAGIVGAAALVFWGSAENKK